MRRLAGPKRTLYPPVEPFMSGRLAVSDGHELHFQQCGKPVVFLHGGPGGGIRPHYRRYFDPEAYRIVLFDQRGCGLSTPWAALELTRECADADILVNNAGAIPPGALEDVDEETWRHARDLKVFGYINMMRAMHGGMKARGRGVIVNNIGTAGDRTPSA